MKPFNIGDLRHRITIEAPYWTESAAGLVPTWVTIPNGEMWAEMKPLRGREAYYAGRPEARHTYRFRIHYNRFVATDAMPPTYPTDDLLAFYGFQEQVDGTVMQDSWASYNAVTDGTWGTAGLTLTDASTPITLDDALAPLTAYTLVGLVRKDSTGDTVLGEDIYYSSYDGGSHETELVRSRSAGQEKLNFENISIGVTTDDKDVWFLVRATRTHSTGASKLGFYDPITKAWTTGTATYDAGAVTSVDSVFIPAENLTFAAFAVHDADLGATYDDRILRSIAPWAKRVHGIDLLAAGGYPTAHQMRIKRNRRYFYIDEVVHADEAESYMDLIAVESDT